MSAVTTPHDDVDTDNPNHPRKDKGWPLSSSGYGPGYGAVDLGSIPRENTVFVRGCGVAFVRPRDTTVPKVGKRGSHLYTQTN